jgi:DNA-directed RNA polymerase specialized sigma24 family protein
MGLEEFDKTIVKIAKAYAIPNMDWQDTAQELRIHLWQQGPKHKPKDYNNWAYIVCRKKIIDLWRKASHNYPNRKGKNIQFVSLDALTEKGFDKEG